MIPLFLLAAVTPLAKLPGSDSARFAACTQLIKSDPSRAITEAQEWARTAADVPSRQCLGLALAAAQRFTDATQAFEQAAGSAEEGNDGRAAQLWGLAGNAALAADDANRAHTDLDRALASNRLTATQKGETWIDRGRADVALGDLAQARLATDAGLKLVPDDGFAWLLSATLARRAQDLDRAEKDIGEAMRIAPEDPEVALEAGNIAAARGAIGAARVAWQHAVDVAPQDPAGKAAAQALAANR
ncbi:tetratricopeptide (TPR) repeat protein [Sphingomonas vulcanisoli]|uniref:Tetratricopeptide (TPR) repeat protein n=1 Tax=Sphingomonas vulcanisoli TaxID=1658060 RepID=A0ABX0TPL7_9SPHN|nr:hypothetical protein [Sphingomonas vulcanisoli]NIJ07478.1 tetratricopeptide (TPR) repeat protein [Sphingomonas vulcanisoli]